MRRRRQMGVSWTMGLLLLLAGCVRESGPDPIAYDRQPCAYCRMLISDPRFAAQLQLVDEDTVSFDDPGCLLLYRSERNPPVRAVWFHHAHEDRWLAEAAAAFVEVPHSPMAYDLGAVDAETPGAMPLAEAARRVQAHGRAEEGGTDATR